MDTPIRCAWVDLTKPHYIQYHDEEWGIAVHDDCKHFEMLILEGAQAGLNWEMILRRRAGYRQAFHQFDPVKVAQMSDAQLTEQLQNSAIVRNRLKVFSVRQNARAFLTISEQFGSFDQYVWSFVNGEPQVNHWSTLAQVPAHTVLSDALAKDLKRRGMSFVGSTIIYAYMQAIGMVNDHTTDCWHHPINT